jgi:mutator protein MutT
VTRVEVVAAAILREGRVLAARRTSPPAAAGRWELPGGKVEPGEDRDQALMREVGEELGVLVEVTDWLAGESRIGDALWLRAATARIVAGEPRPREHDRIRWLAPDELDDVDWLEPDRPFLAQLRERLAAAQPTEVAIFFEEEDARSVADRLESEGWWTRVHRERFQGEDDDEDQPWAVATDAPTLLLELLVDEYDGWLHQPADPRHSPPAPPPDLPTAPRRVRRPH